MRFTFNEQNKRQYEVCEPTVASKLEDPLAVTAP